MVFARNPARPPQQRPLFSAVTIYSPRPPNDLGRAARPPPCTVPARGAPRSRHRRAPGGSFPDHLPPPARPRCHAPSLLPSLPPDSVAPLSSPQQRLAPTRTRRMRRCRRSPSRRAAHAPRGAPHTLLPQPRTEPAPSPHRPAPRTSTESSVHRRNPARRRAPTRGAAAAAPTDLGAGRGRARARQPGRTEGRAGVGRTRHAASEGRRRGAAAVLAEPAAPAAAERDKRARLAAARRRRSGLARRRAETRVLDVGLTP